MTDAPLRGTARGEVPARLLDLSEGGALLVLLPRLDVGAIYDFALDVEGLTVWIQAEVRRCHPAPRGGGFEVGVAFVGIHPHDERRLREFLSSTPPPYPSPTRGEGKR